MGRCEFDKYMHKLYIYSSVTLYICNKKILLGEGPSRPTYQYLKKIKNNSCIFFCHLFYFVSYFCQMLGNIKAHIVQVILCWFFTVLGEGPSRPTYQYLEKIKNNSCIFFCHLFYFVSYFCQMLGNIKAHIVQVILCWFFTVLGEGPSRPTYQYLKKIKNNSCIFFWHLFYFVSYFCQMLGNTKARIIQVISCWFFTVSLHQ